MLACSQKLVLRLQVKRGEHTSSNEVAETRECTLCAKPLMSCVNLATCLSRLSCKEKAAHSEKIVQLDHVKSLGR